MMATAEEEEEKRESTRTGRKVEKVKGAKHGDGTWQADVYEQKIYDFQLKTSGARKMGVFFFFLGGGGGSWNSGTRAVSIQKGSKKKGLKVTRR